MISDEVQPEAENEKRPQDTGEDNSENQPVASAPVDSAKESPEESVETPSEQPEGEQPEGEQAAEAAPAPRRQRAPRGGARAARGQRGAAATADAEPVATEPPPTPRLREMYRNDIVPAIMREFGFNNPMRVPRVEKIVLNIGVGEALTNSRAMESATNDLTIISGQKPLITKARKSIAGFKIREGNPIGTSVTLRGSRMYHFLDRFINMALPRIRDFRGLQRTGFDGRGNYSIGIREQIIFPEIDYNQIDRIRGLQVTIATSARNDAEAIRLLELYGMPFIKQT